ncbi:MAG: 30S ribosomal protein S10 [Candidatus Omnitrophica bacterium]|nr:30S ribosomal protein S10 [Candidatus Omnitrophota bacterium]
MNTKKIRIKVRSFDHRILDESVKQIIEIVKSTGVKTIGPVPLPTKREIYTVIRSPHVHKKSREQFQLLTHKRLIDIIEPSTRTVDALSRINLPSGVEIEMKLE